MSKNLFDQIKKAVLGSKYDLSLVFISPKKIQNLNKIYRNINKPTDILSFPLSKTSGEMFICLSETKKMAKEFDRSYENFLAFLFIHGCVHLKGFDHGPKMEKVEEKFRKKFGI
jgi:probable rRNA maturation factor